MIWFKNFSFKKKLNFKNSKTSISSKQRDKSGKKPLHSKCFLNEVAEGSEVKIVCFEGPPDIALYFMEMGLCVHDKIQVLRRLPFGGNLVILSENGKYTLRKNSARWIKVSIV